MCFVIVEIAVIKKSYGRSFRLKYDSNPLSQMLRGQVTKLSIFRSSGVENYEVGIGVDYNARCFPSDVRTVSASAPSSAATISRNAPTKVTSSTATRL